MKKIIYGSILLGLMAVTSMSSCKKGDNSISSPNLANNVQPDKIDEIVVGVTFVWDEWGRKVMNCAGGGLCNFRLKKN